MTIRPCDGPPYAERPKALSDGPHHIPITRSTGFAYDGYDSKDQSKAVPVPADDEVDKYRLDVEAEIVDDSSKHARHGKINLEDDDDESERHGRGKPKVEHKRNKK